MSGVVYVGTVLALSVFAVLCWIARCSARQQRAAFLLGDRVERKLDLLLHHLALEREKQEIDAEVGR